MTKLQLIKAFEELCEDEYADIECDNVCFQCGYVEICDMLERMLERKKEQEEWDCGEKDL